ncbi:MAG: type II secretion system protein GspG [Phycisphaerales bacterium]|nr:type II secretion system protein GspG [Phycisphaerales bacterium]MCB9856300.1 type II secretion system protein GspG [Phycisphaerales bacterium]MCB9863261.1 type II secretion system protein GspG [Phycisphaerales bacterium]
MIALPAFLPSRCHARKPLAQAAIGPNGSISQAIDLFEYHTGRLPITLDELIDRPVNPPAGDTWRGPYLYDAQGLTDPWGQPFRYKLRGATGEPRYHLWSFGPNGIDDSSDGDGDFGDDVCNWK